MNAYEHETRAQRVMFGVGFVMWVLNVGYFALEALLRN